ncbi:MAG: hypothetical protein L0K27_02685 [Corynebacterium nuruki]|nr:hypothetical protein [Corynebacterium nuruki]
MHDDESYHPRIRLGGFPNPDVDWLQSEADRLGITHAQDIRGDVRRIFSKLNRKSVPLNSAGAGPQRWAYSRVSSLGVVEDVAGTEDGPAAAEAS